MGQIQIKNPDALVSTQWLEAHLHDEGLRVFDCSTILEFGQSGDRPYKVLNCQGEHDAGHIPGAQFLDLQGDFSEADSPYGMTLSSPETVSAAFARMGVDDQSRVVLYSRRSMSWATRFWWMLRWIGFDRAAVLDGGFEKWDAEGRPLSTDVSTYPAGQLTKKLRSEVFVGRQEVLDAIDDPAACMINALGRDIFSGENPRYGRPGRIPGSVNLPKVELVDPETLVFMPADVIAGKLNAVGVDDAGRHLAYCGGGIFATVIAFWLHQLGHENIAVYDNSMSEWGPDRSLPIEVG